MGEDVRKDADELVVQVALRIKAPKGTRFSKKVLQEILDRIASGEDLPKTVEIRGIFWRNPNRRGKLSMWRYHKGADLTVSPKDEDGTPAPRESTPRGNLQAAVETLGNAIAAGVITF